MKRHVNLALESLKELYGAMLQYQDAADCDAPNEYREMMGRAESVLRHFVLLEPSPSHLVKGGS
jgi:hypothetical protein